MLSEFEAKQISDWLSKIENIRSLSSEAQMKLAQANKEIQDAQFQLERASQEVKNIVMSAMMGQQKTTFLFKL
jgi:multidrug resistance efflux pump